MMLKHRLSGIRQAMRLTCSAQATTGHRFLAHRIRISEILPWDRKSYLTRVISHENCILAVLELMHRAVK